MTIFFLVFLGTTLVYLLGALIALNRADRVWREINRPWAEAVRTHDWDACNQYHIKAAHFHNEFGQNVYNPLRWWRPK